MIFENPKQAQLLIYNKNMVHEHDQPKPFKISNVTTKYGKYENYLFEWIV